MDATKRIIVQPVQVHVKPNQTSDTNECPLCGTPYEKRFVIEQGIRWRDFFPGTVFDFFKRYQRRCTSQYDVEEEIQLPEQKQAIYLHTGKKR